MGKHDVTQLQHALDSIDAAFADLVAQSNTDELRIHILKPWFTTPAELELLLASLEAVESQARTAARLQAGLVVAARRIDEEGERAASEAERAAVPA